MGNDEEYCFPNDRAITRLAFYQSQLHPEYHFDDEKIIEGVARLRTLQDQIMNAVKGGRYVEARKKLGAALHAIQDFYSHTNWVELGQRQPFQDANGKLRYLEYADPGQPNAIRVAHDELVCAEPGTNVPSSNTKDLSQQATRGGVLLTSGYFFSPTRQDGQCMGPRRTASIKTLPTAITER